MSTHYPIDECGVAPAENLEMENGAWVPFALTRPVVARRPTSDAPENSFMLKMMVD